MKYIIVPVSNKLAQEHYRSTVENILSVNKIENLCELKLSHFPDKDAEYSVWGSKIQLNGQQKNIEKFAVNDQLIFYKNKKLFSLFNIVSIFKSSKLAQKLWGRDKKNNKMWENIFLLDKIDELDIDVKRFNRIMGFKDGPIRGVKPCVKNDQIWKIHKLINDYFKEYEESITIVSERDEEFNKPLDKLYISKNRGEQSELRIRLIKNNLFENCVICGEKVNKKFLFAAHIKKRELCEESEKRDIYNVAAPMCKFGCDALFEEGYILIKNNGTIIRNKLISDDVLNEKELILINKLINKKVLNFNKKNEKYYTFHFEYHS